MTATTGSFVSLPSRLLTFCRERFPLGASALSALLIATAADLVGQRARGIASASVDGTTLTLAVALLAIMFLLRVADEHKDVDVDRIVHPDRPVQRGVVSLRELATVALLSMGGASALVAVEAPSALPFLVATLAFAGLMWREFFVRAWLRRHLLVVLSSHQLIVPLMALVAFSARGPVDVTVAVGMGLAALGASWVFEVARKIRAPSEEQAAAETYSGELGVRGATLLVGLGVLFAVGGVTLLAYALALPPIVPVVVAVGASLTLWPLIRFARAPRAGQEGLLTLAGALFSLVVYPTLIGGVWWAASLSFGGGK